MAWPEQRLPATCHKVKIFLVKIYLLAFTHSNSFNPPLIHNTVIDDNLEAQVGYFPLVWGITWSSWLPCNCSRSNRQRLPAGSWGFTTLCFMVRNLKTISQKPHLASLLYTPGCYDHWFVCSSPILIVQNPKNKRWWKNESKIETCSARWHPWHCRLDTLVTVAIQAQPRPDSKDSCPRQP